MMTGKNNAYVNVWLFAKTNCVYTMSLCGHVPQSDTSMEPTKRQLQCAPPLQGNQDGSNVLSKNESRVQKVPSKENM